MLEVDGVDCWPKRQEDSGGNWRYESWDGTGKGTNTEYKRYKQNINFYLSFSKSQAPEAGPD